MLTRRRFVRSSLAVGAAGAVAARSGGTSAQATKRLIVDSQVHLWKAEAPDRPWVPGLKPQLPEPFTHEKLVPLMDEAGVERVVIVPPSWEGDRNDYALEAVSKYPGRFAVMGRIPLASPDAPAMLAGWRQQPGLLGLRVTFIGAQVAMLSNGAADWFWPAAEKLGLPVMFLTGDNLPAMLPVAERHPGLPLIIDHMGLSGDAIKAGKTAEVVAIAASFAKFPNVSVKLSAAPSYSVEPYPFSDMTPHIRRLFEAFGPRRSHWGTDLTNSLAKASYRQRIAHFTDALGFMSKDDLDWVMGRAIVEKLKWA